LDPLAGLLLAVRRIEGLALGCVVLVTDAYANQAVITALARALVASVPRIGPWLHPGGAV
jgi:hypothetical protein